MLNVETGGMEMEGGELQMSRLVSARVDQRVTILAGISSASFSLFIFRESRNTTRSNAGKFDGLCGGSAG